MENNEDGQVIEEKQDTGIGDANQGKLIRWERRKVRRNVFKFLRGKYG